MTWRYDWTDGTWTVQADRHMRCGNIHGHSTCWLTPARDVRHCRRVAGYLRFAALGDSTTLGIGDPLPTGWRGWARLLTGAIAEFHDVSFCNLAVSGATAASVRQGQLAGGLAHTADLASLIVGVNDTMRSTWHPGRVREDLLACADALCMDGATLLTVRFHDHGEVLRLPRLLRSPLWQRIQQVNAVYDEIAARHDVVCIDLAAHPEVQFKEFWSVDRLHPSELGHRWLARRYALLLNERGLAFEAPSESPDGPGQNRWGDLHWMVTEGAPWAGRRTRDLGPWAARMALEEVRAAAGLLAVSVKGRPVTTSVDNPGK